MKKNWKLLSLLLLVVLAAGLSGCGQKTQSIAGKWSSEEFAEMMDGDSMKSFFGEDAALSFEFTQDGKLLLLLNGSPIEEAVKELVGKMELPEGAAADMPASMFPEISYKLDGNKITMDMKVGGESDSATGEFRLDGDKLAITIEGQTVNFTRQK